MTDSPNYLTDRTHVVLSGVTGSGDRYGGKTVTANWWATRLVEQGHYDFSVFFDPKGKRFVRGHEVADWKGLHDAVTDGAEHVQVVPPVSADEVDVHAGVVRYLSGLDDHQVVMVHDEADDIDGEWLGKAVSRMGNPGRGAALKNLVVVQHPWGVSETVVGSNTPVKVFVGPVTSEHERYFDAMQVGSAFETIERRHTDPFVWSAIDGGDVTTFDPVPAEYAGE